MKESTVLFLTIIILSCAPKPFESILEDKMPNDIRPAYLSLNAPVGDLSLPGILIGDQQTPSGSCFSLSNGEAVSETDSYNNYLSKAKQDKTFESGLKSALKEELRGLGLSVEISNILSSNVSTEIDEPKVLTIDPESVLPSFDNGTCRGKDLEIFIDDRRVLIGGIRANRFRLTTSGIRSQEQKVAFEAAIGMLNMKYSTDFKKASESETEMTFEATNVFFGALASQLKTSTCNTRTTLNLKLGKSKVYELCTDVVLRVEKSEVYKRKYTISVYTENGETISIGPYDINANKLNSYPLGANRQFSIVISEEDNNNQNVTTDILLVGLSGS